MSIEDDLLEPETITEGDRALELFTDRYEFTRLFVERLNDDPAPRNILFLYGEGGNGKSLLLKHLRQNACKRLIDKETWVTLKAKPDVQLANNVARLKIEFCYSVPTAFLDFGQKPLGETQPQDRFFGLLTLRRGLGKSASASGMYCLLFRRFDFACVWYLYNKGRSPDEIKSFFPLDKASNLVSVLVDVLTKNPFGTAGKAVLDTFNPEWSQWLMVRMARFGLAKDDIKMIFRLDLDTELIEALPRFLADDLNEAMVKDNAPPRIVLFFDTHEAFWGENRSEANITYFFRDEWLRCLLRKLDYEKGIVAVVAGRNQPRWAEAKTVKPNTYISAQYLDLHRVGNLSEADALAYLQQPTLGIADAVLCQSLIAYASVEPGEVHPLHLGLCADVVLQAQAQSAPLTAAEFYTVPEFADKSKLLVERLLKYVTSNVRDAIYTLSACRAFDFELFNQLGEALKFAPYRADFDTITRFSFVKHLPEPRQGWHRLHGLLRRLNYEGGNDQVTQAHRFLEQHYRAKDDHVEAIYHFNQLDPTEGTDEWISTFDQFLALSKYQTCEALLEVRRDLLLTSYFQLGRMSQSEGNYFQTLARYAEAEQEYLESIWAYQNSRQQEDIALSAIINNQGNAHTQLGDLHLKFSQYLNALPCYQEAIALFDEFLEHAPCDIKVLNSKGNVLRSLGELQMELAQHTNALASYQQAIVILDEVLGSVPDYLYALSNKATTLESLGKLQAELAQHADALASYQQAITVFDKVLVHVSDSFQVVNNKGSVLLRLGELQARLAQHTNALISYQQAITTFDEVLHRIPDNIYALNNKGFALQRLGELQAESGQHTNALASYQKAIAAHDEALGHAPNTIGLLNNKGNTLKSLGELQVLLAQDTDASASYKEAIATFDEALRCAPDYIYALNGKGIALQRLADLQSRLTSYTDALASYQQAIATFNEALSQAPNNISALNGKGITLQSLGELQTGLTSYTDALDSYKQAITTYDEALGYAPDGTDVLNNKGLALKHLGELQAGQAQPADALANYQQAIATFDKALCHAPDFIPALNNKGMTLQRLGELQAGLTSYTDALASLRQAIATFDEALRRAPTYTYVLNNKGLALVSLAQLQGSLRQEAEVAQNLYLALTSFSRSLAVAPDDLFIRNLHDQIQAILTGDSSSQGLY